MARIVVIGNAGGGKSTLARLLAARRGLAHTEVDALLWEPGWRLAPENVYARRHAALIAGEGWVLDGLGRRDSIAARIARATEVVLIDMPLWMHFSLAAERQIAWLQSGGGATPGGQAEMPPIRALFRTIAEVDAEWMPALRALCTAAEQRGIPVTRIADLDALTVYAGDPALHA